MEFKEVVSELEIYSIDISNGWNIPGLIHSNVDEMTKNEKDIVAKHLKTISKLFKKAANTI